jgi:hypothetical protein
MPTTRVQTTATKQDDERLFLRLEAAGFLPLEMTVLRGMTLEEMGQLALNQKPTPIPDVIFDGAFDLTWHVEIEPETGMPYRVLDDIVKV